MPEIVHGLAALAQLDPGAAAPILCASHHLTRHLRLVHGRAQAAAGRARWAALETATVGQWCAAVLRRALLAGELPAERAPQLLLSAAQERVLWEEIIAAAEEEGGDFYDRAGLAAAAVEANALVETWRLPLPEAASASSVESARFLAWRHIFRGRCAERRWLEPVRALAWQIDSIARGVGRVPAVVFFAGFDRLPPLESRLARVLAERGARVVELRLEREHAGAAGVHAAADRRGECRAAAAWAARLLARRPDARLGIVAPDLGVVRAPLADELDAALQLPSIDAEAPRPYDFSLGTPLAREPLVRLALELLAIAVAGRGRVEQERFGELLRAPGWSAEAEADGRHRLEARLREKLAPEIALSRLIRFVRREQQPGLETPALMRHLEALAAWSAPARQAPSRWGEGFAELLAAAGWPGDRAPSSRERQARHAFAEALDGLGELDAVLGRVGAGEALRQLRRTCGERIFQPAAGLASITVMGLHEVAAEPFDALWVMGMNEAAWPPPARPNPLLAAELQRRAGTPDASAEVQLELARLVQRRLGREAAEVIFSHAASEDGREQRPSPLLAGLPAIPDEAAPDASATVAAAAELEALDDSRAPALAPGEKVAGGTGLLKAQALCPAWAFYRYRLGARALEQPVEGLDAMARGTLLHAVLERFWQGRDSRALQAMDAPALDAAIAAAVAGGIADFDGAREEPLAPRFLALEAERLQRLAGQWLALEAARAEPFRVVACERELVLELEGIAVRLVIDRIDALDDGRLLILDYKTGAVSAASWGDARIAEPQLPVYAALAGVQEAAADGKVCAAAFARVRLDDCGFVGIAAARGLLPDVAGIGDDGARKLFPQLTSWPELLAHWRDSIAAIAHEIAAGDAAVRFADEKDLAWCEVLPLLRVAERRRQLRERRQGGAAA
jgi:exodeoxyribonuclease-5